ncbi:MAG: XrtA-associated tyrosine autokinase [Gammaproteobacteria bacterium]|nr:protein tyrosine kinase [Gammaproteobacteria bacterium]
MSLVERALKKIQESRAGVSPKLDADIAFASRPAAPVGSAAMPESVEAAPAAPTTPARVVHIDREALRAARVLPPPQEERALAHEYRHIKRPLIARALGRMGGTPIPNGHLIMVASALPGDGKTFTCINLAFSMALEKDLSVLLIDGDVAKPQISELLDLRSEPGLLDVLRDDSLDVESVILSTDVPRLSVLPAGQQTDVATELLASARMEAVLRQITARDPNRIVLLDSPPLLATSESRVLASIAGQIVLVVRANQTPQQAVVDALDLIEEGKSIGLVLNQATENVRKGYYDYYGQSASNQD